MSRTPVADLIPGLLLVALLAALAVWLADVPWIKGRFHVSALLLVILLGMLRKSLLPVPAAMLPGIRLAQRPILRWAVAGLGFRLSLPELWKIGAPALIVVIVSTAVALLFGWWVARRLGVGEKLGLLLGVGGAICGASAVVAADSVVQGEKQDAALALGIITLLGTIGIAAYPVIQHLSGMSDSRLRRVGRRELARDGAGGCRRLRRQRRGRARRDGGQARAHLPARPGRALPGLVAAPAPPGRRPRRTSRRCRGSWASSCCAR